MLTPLPLCAFTLGIALANAQLIPSTVSLKDVASVPVRHLDDSYDYVLSSRPVSTVHYLQCPGCKWFESAAGDYTLFNDTILVVEFAASSDNKEILFNGVPIYPIVLDSGSITALPYNKRVHVTQVSPSKTYISLRRILSFSAVTVKNSKDSQQANSKSFNIDINIDSLDGEPLELPIIRLPVLKASEAGSVTQVAIAGDISIVSEGEEGMQEKPLPLYEVQQGMRIMGLGMPPALRRPSPGVQPAISCGTGLSSLFCRMRSFVQAKFSTAAPLHRHGSCRGRFGAVPKPPMIKGGPAKYWRVGEQSDIEVRPTVMPHLPTFTPGEMTYRREPNIIIRGFHTFIISVVVPVLIGIAAGLTASVLGLMFGMLVAWFWTRFVRGGNKQTAVAANDGFMKCDIVSREEQWVEGDGFWDEKAGYTVEVGRIIAEPPPGYVDKE